MFDVTSFLMRWLFLGNLIRDIAEIQTLPYNPHAQIHHAKQVISNSVSCEEEWRDHCLRGILAYPPGTQRLLVMDAMRAELVQKLSCSVHEADQTLQRYECARRKAGLQIMEVDEQGDPYLDADVEILKAFEQETLVESDTGEGTEQTKSGDRQAVLTISNDGRVDSDQSLSSSSSTHSEPVLVQEEDAPPSAEEVEDAQRTIRTVRDYLPQLVSVVLRSPPAFEPNLLNPIDKLRRVIVKRCVEDANWGVDMCWLLEADVGRAWKTLFEHRQQTGRRLIIVLPAEKAAVLAKIGTEKKGAFDLLQDAEQATAYGYTVPMDESILYGRQLQGTNPGAYQPHSSYAHQQPLDAHRLPSSLSLRRCSHFGDTMHFMDRLTKISLDLRQVPSIHRHTYLQESLKEMNRRIRRRMATRGDVSLDVEDNRSPEDWPLISDISKDMLQYSVHLPFHPKQQKRWPGGDQTSEITDGGVVRVLNIVVEECRTLSSRERCPFLVHVEVAETGLSGNDSRLYVSGAPGLGATVGEALSMSACETGAPSPGSLDQGCVAYQIPTELLEPSPRPKVNSLMTAQQEPSPVRAPQEDEEGRTRQTKEVVRGGWQGDETAYSHHPENVFVSNPYDAVRDHEYEQLHEQMYSEQSMMPPPAQASEQRDPLITTREALLDKVFGQAWADKCEEIRQASPFGKTEGWRLASFIMKAGEDIRREAMVMQVIAKLNEWFQLEIPEENRPHMRPYTIMCLGGDSGLVECLSDAKSIDEVKKSADNFVSLRDYFERAYGPPTTHSANYMRSQSGSLSPGQQRILSFEKAQDNFLRSLVGYSLVSYIIQIKDRHNANILLDREGNIVHIDFGYVLGDSPKSSIVPIFNERAPFKLSAEFWDVLGGWSVNRGGLGVRFCNMFEIAFASASAHTEEIVSLIEATMLTLTESPRQARFLANGVRSRLRMRGPPGSIAQKSFIMELVNAALTDLNTKAYDWLQKNMNGYE